MPTTVHAVFEAHDTPLSNVWLKPGLGLGTTDQRLPFQDSISEVVGPLLWKASPAAVHASGETQDTPLRKLPLFPGLGVGSTDHRVPFQDSARVPWKPLSLPEKRTQNRPTEDTKCRVSAPCTEQRRKYLGASPLR